MVGGPRVPPAAQKPALAGDDRLALPAAPGGSHGPGQCSGCGQGRRGVRCGWFMTLRLYNTLTRQTEAFEPLQPGKVSLYTCGPTVYNYAHIGNFRTFLFEDLLRRWLEASGYDVFHI